MEVADGGPTTLAGDARCDTQVWLIYSDARGRAWTERQQPHRRDGTRASVRGEPVHLCITYSV